MNSSNRFFIGIDVSKPFFDASLMQVTDHQKGGYANSLF